MEDLKEYQRHEINRFKKAIEKYSMTKNADDLVNSETINFLLEGCDAKSFVDVNLVKEKFIGLTKSNE